MDKVPILLYKIVQSAENADIQPFAIFAHDKVGVLSENFQELVQAHGKQCDVYLGSAFDAQLGCMPIKPFFDFLMKADGSYMRDDGEYGLDQWFGD